MPNVSESQFIKHVFPNGQSSSIMKVADGMDYAAALAHLDLKGPVPTLLVIGGASKMAPESKQKLLNFFNTALADLSSEFSITVIDGGTDAGVIHMMGQARQSTDGQFDLIGVAPLSKVCLPGDSPSPVAEGEYPLETLEPHHTHFFLVPGDDWGSESHWLAEFSNILAGCCPSLTLLINGGQVSLQDLQVNLEKGRQVLVIAGSGRLADQVAAAIGGTPPEDDRIQQLINAYGSQLSVADLSSPLAHLYKRLHGHFQTLET